MNELNRYQQEAADTATAQADLTYAVLGLTNEAGEVAGKLKKHLRGDGPLPREAMLAELGDVLWYLARCAALLDAPLSEVAAGNLAKLRRRKLSGTIRGDGDSR